MMGNAICHRFAVMSALSLKTNQQTHKLPEPNCLLFRNTRTAEMNNFSNIMGNAICHRFAVMSALSLKTNQQTHKLTGTEFSIALEYDPHFDQVCKNFVDNCVGS